LGRPIAATGTDWPAVKHNINRAQVSKILTRQGATPKVMGYFYKAVCQAILLYSCETWVVTHKIRKALESFHHRVARQISNLRIRIDPNTGDWIYPPLNVALTTASLLPLEEYVLRRRSYLLAWARDRPILQQSQQLQRGIGAPQHLYWWSYCDQ
jgi:hypothetical protein